MFLVHLRQLSDGQGREEAIVGCSVRHPCLSYERDQGGDSELTAAGFSVRVSRVPRHTSSRLQQVWGHGGVERVATEGSVASCVCCPVLVPSACSALDMEGLDLDLFSLTFPRKRIGHKRAPAKSQEQQCPGIRNPPNPSLSRPLGSRSP